MESKRSQTELNRFNKLFHYKVSTIICIRIDYSVLIPNYAPAVTAPSILSDNIYRSDRNDLKEN